MTEPENNEDRPVIAILAGGLATRLRPITETIPKSMVLVAGEPFISYQLRMLARQGFRDIVILCGFLGDQILDYVGNGAAFGCNVRYAFDGETRRGTGGAILNALPMLGEKFLVIYGDSYCSTDYRAIYSAFAASGKCGLMTVFHNRDLWDRSNVVYENGRIVLYDKDTQRPEMHFIDYGINVFSKDAFTDVHQRAAFDLAEIQTKLVECNQLAGFEVKERFYEVGSHAGLNETDEFLTTLKHEDEMSSEYRKLP
jgi:NDP-sugar pyrophosphorylase family protein